MTRISKDVRTATTNLQNTSQAQETAHSDKSTKVKETSEAAALSKASVQGDQLETARDSEGAHLVARDAAPAKDSRVGSTSSFGLVGLLGENRRVSDEENPPAELAKYRIGPGETTQSIAKKLGVSLQELGRLNAPFRIERLGPGRDINIPGDKLAVLQSGSKVENADALVHTGRLVPKHKSDSAASGSLFDFNVAGVRVGISPGLAVGLAPIDENLGLSAISLPRGVLTKPSKQKSLVVDAARVGEMRARATRGPYVQWSDTVLTEANRALSRNLSVPSMQERERSSLTKACAFAYTLTGDKAYLNKAEEGLSHIAPPNDVEGLMGLSKGGSSGGGGWERHLTAGESMQHYGTALDMLKDELKPETKELAADALVAQGKFMQQAMPLIPNNNWKTRAGAGLGTAALALNGVGRHDEAKALLNAAMGGIERGMAQSNADGVYNEGPSYATYTNQTLIPFVRQYQRATGVNLAADPKMKAYFEGSVSTRMPNGKQPAFDDAHTSKGSRLAMLVDRQIPGASNYRFDFEHAASKHMGRQSGEAIAYFDDAVRVPREPTLPATRLQQDSGQAIFRSGYEKDDTYSMFVAEKRSAPGHEHIDPGNLMLAAHGKELLIPPGYGPKGYATENKEDYRAAAAHNMVLINGKGPSGSGTVEMAGMYDAGALQGASESHQIGDAELRRHITFVDKNYMVIDDETRSPDACHAEVVLHGNGELERATSKGATWNVDGVKLQAVYLGDTHTINTKDALHSFGGNQEEHHSSVTATMDGKKNHLLTVLLPVAEGEKAQIKKVASEGPGEAKRVATSQTGRGDLIMAGDGVSEVKTRDAAFVGRTAIIQDGSGELEGFSLRGATDFDYQGKTICSADKPINLAIDLDAQGGHGFLSAPNGPTKVFLDMGSRQPSEVRFNGAAVALQKENGRPYIMVEGEATLDLAFNGAAQATARGAELVAETTPELLGKIANASNAREAVKNLSDEERAQLEAQISTELGKGLYSASVKGLAEALNTSPERVATVAAVGAGWLQFFVETGKLPVDIAVDTLIAGAEVSASVRSTARTNGEHSFDGASVAVRGENAEGSVSVRTREEGLEVGGQGRVRLENGSVVTGAVSTGTAGTNLNAGLRSGGVEAGLAFTNDEKHSQLGGHVSGTAGEAHLAFDHNAEKNRVDLGGSTQLGDLAVDQETSLDKNGVVATETGVSYAGKQFSGHGRLRHERNEGQRLSGGAAYDHGRLHAGANLDVSHKDGATSLDVAGLRVRTTLGTVGLGAWGSRTRGGDGASVHAVGASVASSLGKTAIGLEGKLADDGSQSILGNVSQPLSASARLGLSGSVNRSAKGDIAAMMRAEVMSSGRFGSLGANARLEFDQDGVQGVLAGLSYEKVDYRAFLEAGYERHAGPTVRAGVSWNLGHK